MPRLSRDRWTAILMITPSIILLAVFVYGFIGQTLYTAMTDWGDPRKSAALAENPTIEFIGLKNFQDLFNGLLNYRFRIDMVNTVFFTILFLAACLGLGLLMAILLDQKVRGESIFRTVFLFPMSLSFVVTGTVWRWLFAPNGGLNMLPTLVGLPPLKLQWFIDRTKLFTFGWPDVPKIGAILLVLGLLIYAGEAWLHKRQRSAIIAGVIGLGLAGYFLIGQPKLTDVAPTETHGLNAAILSIVLAATWQMSGYTMAMYLAGLRGIPEELREAARVDGCNEWQVYRYIILPLLQPITLSAVIILGHISLKIFDLVYVMAGDTNLQVDVPGINMYLTAFRANNFAVGAAIAIVMLIMVAVIIVPYLINQFRTEVHV